MTTLSLMIYFILMPSGCWQFVAIDYAPTAEHCRMEAGEVAKVFTDQPGNMRIVCAADQRVWA